MKIFAVAVAMGFLAGPTVAQAADQFDLNCRFQVQTINEDGSSQADPPLESNSRWSFDLRQKTWCVTDKCRETLARFVRVSKDRITLADSDREQSSLNRADMTVLMTHSVRGKVRGTVTGVCQSAPFTPFPR